VAGLLRREKPGIVHAHGWGQCSLYAVTGARLAGVPVVINGEHGAVFTRRRQIFLQKITALLSNTLLSVSESLKRKVAEELGIPARKIKVIHNGVDTGIFTGGYDVSGLKEELIKKFNFHIDTKSLVIGSVGSLKRQKNQIILLEALKALNIKNPDNNIKAIFAGDGPDKLMLEKYVTDNGMKGQAVFLGERNDIPRLLSLFDIFVSTSLSEGFSNVILEATSSAVPVIATKSVGTPELVYDGTNGFIVYPPVEAAGFAEKIKLLADDPRLLKELSANARRLTEENFSIKSMVSSYEKLYSDSLN
ncbi:glycosyltransferase family 1 protein, partial [bacterium]